MRAMLDSNLLRCFLAVLEHRKLTTAAQELCVTQPALSKSLRRLETELGVPLFERTPAGMVPTDYGIALGQRARLIDLESRSARAELQVLREGGVGSITIGIGPMWSVYGLPEAIGDLVRQQSRLRVKVVSGVLDTLLPQLLKAELDVVCVALDFPEHPNLVKRRLIESEHVIVASRAHPLAGLSNVRPEDLLDYPFVGLVNDYAGLDRMEKYFALHGLPSPGAAVEASSLEMLLSLLAVGPFVASMAVELLDRGERLGLKRLAVDGSFWRFEAGLVYRRSSQATRLVETLARVLSERIAKRNATRAGKHG
jgi:DNA-binding transcriptional LysR family regulator